MGGRRAAAAALNAANVWTSSRALCGNIASIAPAVACHPVAHFGSLSEGAARYRHSFLSPPHSLEFDRGQVRYPASLEGNVLGRAVLALLGAYSRRQQLHNGAAVLYQAMTAQAENEELQDALGLARGAFMTPHHLLGLHMWLLVQRLRGEARADAAPFQQTLYSQFFQRDVERRVYKSGVQVRASKWIKRLEEQWYGSSNAYDMALKLDQGSGASSSNGGSSGAASGGGGRGNGATGHAAFVDALVRNVYGGETAAQPYAQLMARYLLRELQCLQLTPTEAVYAGQVKFSTDIQAQG